MVLENIQFQSRNRNKPRDTLADILEKRNTEKKQSEINLKTIMESKKESNSKIITVLKWIFSVLFLFSFLGSLMDKAFLSAIIFLLIGLLLLPTLTDFWRIKLPFLRNKLVKFVFLFVLSIIGFSTNPNISKNKVKKQTEIESKIVNENLNTKQSANEIEVIDLDKVYYDANGNKKQPDENDITFKIIEVLKHEKNEARESENNFENLYVLVKVSSYKKEDIEKIAFKIKDEYADFAPNNCNVDLWDDKKAYETYLAQQKYYTDSFDELMKEFERTRKPIGEKHQELKEKYDRKNYPFIADHNIGSIMLGNVFSYYQLQDDYYKEMGGKNYKK